MNEKNLVKVTDPKCRNADGKLQVDIVFAKPGVAMPFFKMPPFEKPEDLQNDFDKPEELMFVKSGGMLTLIHKRDLEYVQKREKVAHEVLEEYGIISFEQMGDISMDKLKEMRQKIEERVKDVN
jgi:hypothetical protein